MINENENKRISRFLSLVLRHKPETLALVLDENGWADIAVLLSRMNDQGFSITPEILKYIVNSNNKQRFAIDTTGTRIRANQGHSIIVDLKLPKTEPPEFLFHGTGEKNVVSILEKGLNKGKRHHVHLSLSRETAKNVGQRHGKPRVFIVSALQMHQDGFTFYISENNVWLVEQVPSKYLELMNEG